jgi:hypothetical protein
MANIPTLAVLKSQAKSLRASLGATGHVISHAQSLELIAKQHGVRDWNTLHAAAGTAPLIQLGQQISGRYLGQAFRGEVIRASNIDHGLRSQITVRFDTPVNVSKFDSMVVERRQVTATIDQSGVTVEKTSDGTPHMAVSL